MLCVHSAVLTVCPPGVPCVSGDLAASCFFGADLNLIPAHLRASCIADPGTSPCVGVFGDADCPFPACSERQLLGQCSLGGGCSCTAAELGFPLHFLPFTGCGVFSTGVCSATEAASSILGRHSNVNWLPLCHLLKWGGLCSRWAALGSPFGVWRWLFPAASVPSA